MAVYNFNSKKERVTSMDAIPDFRSDTEREFTPLSIFNHDKPDIAYAERMSEELINICGAWVTVYLKEPKPLVKQAEVWDEDADPIYRNGIEFKAYIKPETVSVDLTKWGIDNPLKLKAIFHRTTIVNKLGARLIAPGDAIEVPYNAAKSLMISPPRPFYFRILNVFDSGNFQYRWLYYTAVAELITGDKSLRVLHK